MFLQQNQTEEVQMAAQGRMEADDIIQELKKQKVDDEVCFVLDQHA
jgi:hypothetical protein